MVPYLVLVSPTRRRLEPHSPLSTLLRTMTLYALAQRPRKSGMALVTGPLLVMTDADPSSTGVSGGSTGFATGTAPGSTGTGIGGASGPQATGSPIVPTVSPSGTSPAGPKFTGAASRNLGSFAAAAVAVAGLAVAL